MAATLPGTPEPQPWSLASKLAFRFGVVYFTLYVCLTQMLGDLIYPGADLPSLDTLRPFRTLVEWTAAHLFHATLPLVVTDSGSGDKTFDWVEAFVLVGIALAATAVWSVLDRRRKDYSRLHGWFRLFLRFALGSTMISYGSVKAVPLQMPAPSLARLLEPYGRFSPMGVLWSQVGASRAYEMAVGGAELLGGVLLFLPATALLGALVCLIDTTHIFLLNMTYDVPVKLFSFHLILMSLFLIAPDASRVLNVLLLNRRAEPRLSPRPRRRWLALGAQAVFGLYHLVAVFGNASSSWYEYGGGAPRSPLYDIWTIDTMTENGVVRAPLATDVGRWRRLVAQSPTYLAFQRMDDTFVRFGSKFDGDGTSLVLSRTPSAPPVGTFTVTRPSLDQLVLDGTLNGRPMRLELRSVPLDSFLLVSRGFHWIQEYPFNQ